MIRRLARLFVAGGLLIALALPLHAAPDGDTLHTDVVTLVEAQTSSDDALDPDALVARALIAHGDLALLHAEVQRRAEDESSSAESRRRARRLGVELHHRDGELVAALGGVDALLAEQRELRDLVRRAELLDALGRGKQAREAYEDALQDAGAHPEIETRLRLRLALLVGEEQRGTTSAAPVRPTVMIVNGVARVVAAEAQLSRPPSESAQALMEFASAPDRDPELRNRAAVLLGLLGHPEEALDLYGVTGEGKERFRRRIRTVEWALDADRSKDAQEAAWAALDEATLRRDRVYALNLLVEAHRQDETLAVLIERFRDAEQLEPEARNVWIDLLRETGQVDEALRLFRAANESTAAEFTIEMRRELLELCRQSGRDDVLVDAYAELIRGDAERIEWREGLSRFHLERGDREEALAAWNFKPGTPSAVLLAAAKSMAGLGLDEHAIELARTLIERKESIEAALLFLSDLHRSRGRFEEAFETLERMDELVSAESPARMQLAESFERLGKKDRAVTVLEGVIEARGAEAAGEDLEMHLAWLYSELGREEQALTAWHELWAKVESVPRRRYVEDRLMTVAARLGKLADIVVELEESLMSGEAESRDAGLLVRIYTKVGDAVSAAEIIDEFMRQSGRDRLAALTEKAFVYLACTDYVNYEQTLDELMELNPEGRPDYLQQLAMSKLERGRLDEAREVLADLRTIDESERGHTAHEFEAGVLAIAGLREEAAAAYRRGIAGNPAHIDSYLLLGQVLAETGKKRQAVQMFQYLVEHAPKDDLFTIAIDGLLNLEASPQVVRWARRITHERLVTKHQKVYLYRLVADLSEELQDADSQLRSLEAVLPIAGEQRTSMLRELMDLSRSRGYRSLHLSYGRRLLGSGELVPPQVYLELGEAFLADDDPSHAAETFSRASDLPDQAAFQRRVAQSFEQAGYLEYALGVYQRVLISDGDDAALLAKIGELHEQLGNDARAHDVYATTLDMLLTRRPLSVDTGEKDDEEPERPAWWRPRNVDEFDKEFPRVLRGFLATAEPDAGPTSFQLTFDRHRTALASDLAAIGALENTPDRIEGAPRVRDRARLLRRIAIAFGRPDLAEAVDLELVQLFPEDAALLRGLVRGRIDWGLRESARRLVDAGRLPEAELAELRFLLGDGAADAGQLRLPIAEAARLVLPLWRDGDRAALRELLLRVDLVPQDKEGLEGIAPLLWSAIELGDPELILLTARKWVRLAARHERGSNVERQVDLVLGRTEKALTEEQQLSLVQSLVAMIQEDPATHTQLIAYLPKLQERFDEPLLTTEQALELIEALAARRSWGMGDLLHLIPPEEALTAIRTVVENAPESRRAAVIPQLLGGLESAVEPDLARYAAEQFESALDGAVDEWFLRYVLGNSPVRNEANLPVFVRFAELLLEKNPAIVENDAALATYLHGMGEAERAREIARTRYREFVEGHSADWQWRNAIRRMQDLLLPDDLGLFLTVLDEVEASGGGSSAVVLQRIELLRRDGTAEDILAALAKGVADHPDDVALREQYLRQLNAMNRTEEATSLLRSMVEDKPQDQNLHLRLRGELMRRGDWIGALDEVRRFEAAAEAQPEEAPDDEPPPEKIASASIMTVKQALDDDRIDDAQRDFRRVWRMFGTDSRFFASWLPNRVDQLRWPVVRATTSEERTPEEERIHQARRRGGLARFETYRETTPVPPVFAYEQLATTPFGEDEIRRLMRTLDASTLGRISTPYVGLRKAMAARMGPAEAVAELVERSERGVAGKFETTLLLSLLEAHPEVVDSALRATLDQLTRAVPPSDGNAIQQLARIHARLGETEEARRLYRWCAYLSTAGGTWGLQTITPVNARTLVDDALANLEGDDLAAVIDAVIDAADPGEEHWGRDSFETLALETLIKAGGNDLARSRGARFIENVTDAEHAYKRGTAKLVAYLLADGGRLDDALRTLEFAVCRAEETAESLLLPAWQRQRRNMNTQLGFQDLHRLFPSAERGGDGVASTGRVEWLRRAANGIGEWVDADRLDEAQAFTALAILAVRLHEAGGSDEARALLPRLRTAAGESTERRVFLADVLRRLGDDDGAHELERSLLVERRLYLARIPDVLAEIARRDGPATALELGEPLTRLSTHADVLEPLLETARTGGDEAAIARFTDLLRRSNEAKAELEKDDD